MATPIAMAAGVTAMAAVTPDLPPLLRWTLAIVAGGGAAGLAQMGSAFLRLQSATFTAGLGNAVVATGELAGAVALSLLGLLAPAPRRGGRRHLLVVLAHRVSRWRARRRTRPA
jgi:hypothetical protein